tara:strand:- start:1104 stop:1514 length:411 start_codon:yes stop_codon:yes gene_type:complete
MAITVHTIKVIKKHGVWSFTDRERGIHHAEFCNGADIILNYYLDNVKKAYIMFSNKEFPEVKLKKLIYLGTRGAKLDYETIVRTGKMNIDFQISLGKPLLQYYPEAPEKIYYKIIEENENQKPNSERSSSSSERFT